MALEYRAGIVGATGYIGGELLRFLFQHPFFDLVYLASHKSAGKQIEQVFPHLRSLTENGRFHEVDPVAIAEQCDVCFLSLPHGEALDLVPALREKRADLLIVDLSSDFRLRSGAAYERHYGKRHPSPALLSEFIYALPEKYRGELFGKKSLAAPGCFATAGILLLEPLRVAGLLPPFVVVDAKTGSSGSGSTPGPVTHHPERDGDFRAYSPLGHRHEAEIRQEIPGVEVAFVPQSAPMVRGIYATVAFQLESPREAGEIRAAFASYYEHAPFVRLLDEPPRVKSVVTTNYCDIAVFVRDRTVVVLGALDNLVKGGAGQAIQAANLALGLPEAVGLETVPAHP